MVKHDYINIKIKILEEYFDLSMAVFQDYDFCGIEEGIDELTVTFDIAEFEKLDTDDILNSLNELGIESEIISIEKISDKNWNEEWERHVQPVIVSEKIVITPTHHASEFNNEIKIIIDPKMSFGTGHHTTTRLMCKLMENLVMPGSDWIDVGTGTGVLAILASKLGAKSIYAFDNNEWSIENAVENIEKNNVKSNISLELADIDSSNLYDTNGIAANIFLNLAVPSLEKFKKSIEKHDGDLLISGIMIYDEKILLKEAEKHNLKLINKLTEDEWAAFHFKIGDKND
ncbi:MAG: 50S ribosomal protein L11 methyltransferase [Candidatus Kapabacteria bacterium]|nr:50S ribosomal protein L11 methyltransferase [Ignavibacteriota bacterium]MCW5884525.1 50S ribosomal protein L11 methyltransferase [Candidatus Kapabacteria bacterium]